MATIVLGRASPEPLRVCTNSLLRCGSGLYFILALLAWKSVKLEHEDASSHLSAPGAYSSRS